MKSVATVLRNPLYLTVVVVLVWLITAFLLLPLLNVTEQTFVTRDGLSLRAIERLTASDRAMSALLNSFILAAVLCVSVNVVGVFLVLVTRYFRIAGSRILWLGYATTLIYGGIVQAAAYRLIYGADGIITQAVARIYPDLDRTWFSGFIAVAIVMTLAGTGLHLLFLSAALKRVDFQTIEAAKLMGASTWTVLRKIVLPTLKPMILAITILTFVTGLSALAAPQVLGGQDFQTIAPIVLSFANSPRSRDLAATLALVLGVATLILLVIFNRMEKGGVYFSVAKVSGTLRKQRIESTPARLTVTAAAWFLWLVYATPPVIVLIYSFTDARTIQSGAIRPDSFTLENYQKTLTDPGTFAPFMTSLLYGASVAVIVAVLMLFAARMCQRYDNPLTRALEYAIHIPWVLPTTLLALGLVITFNRPQWIVAGQVLTGTVYLLAIAYILTKLPFTFRLLRAAFAGVSDNVEEAAQLLGAGPLYTFRRVLLPLVLPTVAAITAVNFNTLLDDYDAAVFLASPFHQPLGIFIRNATIGETTQDSTAIVFVYTVLLMVISSLVMWLVYGRSNRERSSISQTEKA